MNQEQVTTENTEEKAAEVTASSEMAGQTQEAVRPKGKWFGRGIYGSKDVPIRILDGLIGVLIVVIVGMIIFFAVRGGFNIVYDTDGGSEVAARKVRYGEFLTEPETPYKPGYTFDGWYTEKEGETVLWYFQSEKVTGDMTLTAHWVPAQFTVKFDYDGGTGAAPRTSIKHAGLPWELGIAETHQTLILNGLRSRVRIESDSKLLSGRDVAISCMLGAEEFGFGTSLLMCEGCVMMRVCNLDTCPMGICTQNPELRKRFKGKPEYIINYLTFVAQELREYMAKLGVRTIDELVGRTDLLHVKPSTPGSRTAKMNLDCILHNPAIPNSNIHFVPADTYDFHLENTLDMKVLMKKFKLNSKTPQSVTLDVSNTDRALGAIFGSEITRKYGDSLPDDVYTANCSGAGGQSFGAFIPHGLTLMLTGDCNDYMGKGLSGGKIVVRPPQGIDFKPEENIITGNVALYGATSGKAFISGVAGERFAVRNSGATAVVEGVGDHGCEYMTGGTVVVLGQTGKNFAAGMTGGIAYVLDENWDFYQRVNKETVSLEPVEHKYDVATLKELIRAHVEATGSPRGKEILDNFSAFLPKFKKVLPYDYDRMLRVIASVEERGLDGEQAQIEAFYAVQKHK